MPGKTFVPTNPTPQPTSEFNTQKTFSATSKPFNPVSKPFVPAERDSGMAQQQDYQS